MEAFDLNNAEQMAEEMAEQLSELELCANGRPYFLIVEDGDNVVMRVTPKFDISLVFQAIGKLIKNCPEHKDDFANEIIKLSEELRGQ